MPIGSATNDVQMINIALTAADGSAANWQDPTQMIPSGMNGNPEAFVAAIRTGLPLVNNLRVMFNEYSFNADGSMNPQFERFLAAAAAQGFQLTICYGCGHPQPLGTGHRSGCFGEQTGHGPHPRRGFCARLRCRLRGACRPVG